MSRSYKRAVLKGDNCKKVDKRLAAKAVRNCNDVPDGSFYKKVYNSYNITDYVSDCRFDPETRQYASKYKGLVEIETYIGSRPDRKKRRDGWYINK